MDKKIVAAMARIFEHYALIECYKAENAARAANGFSPAYDATTFAELAKGLEEIAKELS